MSNAFWKTSCFTKAVSMSFEEAGHAHIGLHLSGRCRRSFGGVLSLHEDWTMFGECLHHSSNIYIVVRFYSDIACSPSIPLQ